MEGGHGRPGRRTRQHKGRSSLVLFLALITAALLVGTTLKSHLLVNADLRPQGEHVKPGALAPCTSCSLAFTTAAAAGRHLQPPSTLTQSLPQMPCGA